MTGPSVMMILLPAASAGRGACTLVLIELSGMRMTISEAFAGGGAGWPRIDMICCREPVGSGVELSGRMAVMVPNLARSVREASLGLLMGLARAV